MTCSFKGNNSVLILCAPPPSSLASVSFPIFHLPLPTRISRDSPLGTPSVVPSGGWPAPGPGSRNQMLLLLWPHSSPTGGTGFPLPPRLCLLPEVQRLFPYLTADLLQLISAFSWTEQPGSGRALQNGN